MRKETRIVQELVLDAINESIGRTQIKGSNEWNLLDAMSRLPKKYDFGDKDVYLEIKLSVFWEENGEEKKGDIKISRNHDHSSSEPFQFMFQDEGEGAWRYLRLKKKKWIFVR